MPHGRWRTLTFLAALRCDRIDAPCVLDGPTNGLSLRAYGELKTLLRKTDPRTSEDTWKPIGALLEQFAPQECANYLANAGYASTQPDRALVLWF